MNVLWMYRTWIRKRPKVIFEVILGGFNVTKLADPEPFLKAALIFSLSGTHNALLCSYIFFFCMLYFLYQSEKWNYFVWDSQQMYSKYIYTP